MAYIGVSPSNGVRKKFTYTATAGQTSFSGSDNNGASLVYTDTEYLDVYQNGVKLVAVSDYASTTGTSVVLTQGASVSDIIEIIAFDVFSVADTVSASDGGSFGGNVGVGGTLSVTGNVISPITLAGTTPTLTIGDAGAEDAKIVFDGNAQDYHIGLDDSADTLNIGKGSALGTTTSMTFNANGIVTKPLQPAFRVHKTSAQTASGNMELVTWNTEELDIGGNFASNLFTAPVAGTYLFHLTALTPSSTDIETYDIGYTPVGGSVTELMKFMSTNAAGYESLGGSAIRLMGAGEKMGVYLQSTNDTMYGDGNRWSTFFGYLIG